MTFKNTFSKFAVGATLAVSATVAVETAAAETTAPNACFADYQLGPVSAYRRVDQQEYGYQEELAGAHVFIYARPGLTAEWLHYSLERQRAIGQVASECPLDVPGARLSVQSGGPGFWVTLSTDNVAAARQILQRAEHLERR